MTIDTTKYVRKPLYVDAVQVTEENLVAVAEWCNGEIRDAESNLIPKPWDENADAKKHHVYIRVSNPKNLRQTKAFVNDWVLYSEIGGYKIYTPKAFETSFDPVEPSNQLELESQDGATDLSAA